jgi:hypothetical protein
MHAQPAQKKDTSRACGERCGRNSSVPREARPVQMVSV